MLVRCVALLIGILPITMAAQGPSAIPLEQEPHHQLMLQNDEVMVFKVKLLPGERLQLHRHGYDEASMTMSDGKTVAIFPGQPEINQTDVSGTVRFHRAGVVHVIRNVSDTPYYLHESISLLRPQGNVRNFCAVVVDDQPKNCADHRDKSSVYQELQYETDRMRAAVTHIPPLRTALLGERDRDDLIVAIDHLAITTGSTLVRVLQPGDCLWVPHKEAAYAVQNKSNKEVRFATFAFRTK